MMKKHNEHKSEIDTRTKDLSRFQQKGKAFIMEGHFLSEEIQQKMDHLDSLFERLVITWEQRQV